MTNGENSDTKRALSSITPLQLAGIIIGVLAVVGIVWFIYSSVNDTQAGSTMSSSGTARGLITFSVAIVTVAIALILVLYVTMGTAGEDFKDRFTFGKDILMVFVGILGTIMGYYYAENKLSPGAYEEVVAASAKQQDAKSIVDVENAALAALFKKDYDAALKGFGEAYALAPTRHNIDEINKLLLSKKDAFSKAQTDGAREQIWRDIFCDISTNKRTYGMTKDMIAMVPTLCNPGSSTGTAGNGNGNANGNGNSNGNN